MKVLLLFCLFYSTFSPACQLAEGQILKDVTTNSRLFSDFEENIPVKLEQILEDRLFDRPRLSRE